MFTRNPEETVTESVGAVEAPAENPQPTPTPSQPDPETQPAPPADLLESLQAELAAAQADAARYMDNWQRAVADHSNYKKRQQEQAIRRQEEQVSAILSQLFPALDDFDLAFKNIPPTITEQEQNWVDGFTLVQRKLLKLLETYSVETINAQGQFDPTMHEAITHEESPNHPSNTIIAELRKGYKMGDRILRPSLVRVAQ